MQQLPKSRFLVIGGGYLGSVISGWLSARGHAVAAADYPDADITSPASLEALLELHRPQVVVNCAAFTDTAAAELPENAGKLSALNVQGPLNLHRACRTAGAVLVHFSTGMLFDGIGPGGQGFTEEDLPEPESAYAWSKAWSDAALAPFAGRDRLLVLRIHLPLSSVPHPRNFVDRLLRFDKGVDAPSSVTVVDDLLPALEHLLAAKAYGLYHAVNPGAISSFGIMRILQEEGLIDPAKQLRPLPLSELEAMGGAKQAFPLLSTVKLEAAGAELPVIEDAVRAMAKRYAAAVR